jgi:hypothetical protein
MATKNTTTPHPEQAGLLPLDSTTKEKKRKVFAAADKAKKAAKPKAEKKSDTPFVDSLVAKQKAEVVMNPEPVAVAKPVKEKKERKPRAAKPKTDPVVHTDLKGLVHDAVSKAVAKANKAHEKEMKAANKALEQAKKSASKAAKQFDKDKTKAVKSATKGLHTAAEVKKAADKAYATGYREGKNAAMREIKAALKGGA